MGEQRVSIVQDEDQMQHFVERLLDDVQALEYMLEHEWFEDDITRIGAEQEMCLIHNSNFRPASIAPEVLEKMKKYPWAETELARFNLEVNLKPRTFRGKALSQMEAEVNSHLTKIQEKLKAFDSSIILTGVLPTLRKPDLGLHNLTPKKRYFALIESIRNQLIGEDFELRLLGIDELLVKHDSPLLEACNTSFQVHLQVAPKDFVKQYNIAQILAAPVMAIAANSPIVFGRRLWHESRIAMFQQALDTRSCHAHMRERAPRVNFGGDWLNDSIMEIYKEDIARFRVLLSADVEENAFDMIREGKTPKLRALQVHNSTVYRWNRPCYGISPNGKPHLRIENRVLPSGPTVLDEMANAAFWLGAMVGYSSEMDNLQQNFSYADVRDNFGKAARYGIDSKFTWKNDSKISARDLILKEILPMARKGLEMQKVDPDDINRYLKIIEQRTRKHTNGARWQLRAYTKLLEKTDQDEALTCLTGAMMTNQQKGTPVHRWKMPEPEDLKNYRPTKLRVEEFMVTDLFTVQKDDVIDLVAEMMDWRKIRFTPVEDSKGKLVGLVTSRLLLKHLVSRNNVNGTAKKVVKDIMIEDPITISPDATLRDAMNIMRENMFGCLPVVTEQNELIGIITEMDFIRISARLIDRLEDETSLKK